MPLPGIGPRGLRGRDTLIGHIERTGHTIAGDPVWTAEELSVLRRLYPDYATLTAALSRRTVCAIQHKARQIGLVPPWKVWGNADVTRLRRPYVSGVPIDALIQLFPGKTKRQIWNKASAKGYRRPRRPPKATGLPLVDSIRDRAFHLRIPMNDLDAFVARKGYFTSPRHIDWVALQRAMILLGGMPHIRWLHA